MINAKRTPVVNSPAHIHHRNNFANKHRLSQRLEDALEAASALKQSKKKHIFLEEVSGDGCVFHIMTKKQIATLYQIKPSHLNKHYDEKTIAQR